MNAKLTDPKQIKEFILAGDALFTVENRDTGNHYTYRVRASERTNFAYRFVSVLHGPENENAKDYSYIGMISPTGRLTRTRAVHISPDAQSVKAFNWLWERIRAGKGLPEQVEFWHAGKCGRCGRVLTVPSSVESGIGPECERIMSHA